EIVAASIDLYGKRTVREAVHSEGDAQWAESPGFYIVPYQPNITQALNELKQREFNAGRYNPATPFSHLSGGSAGAGTRSAPQDDAGGASGVRRRWNPLDPGYATCRGKARRSRLWRYHARGKRVFAGMLRNYVAHARDD